MPFLRLYADGHLQKQWSLTTNRLTIGRANDNDIVLPNPRVSKHHAVIEKEDNAFILIDQQSANGSFIKEQRVNRHTLEFWDEIKIHPYTLIYMALAKLPGEEEGLDTQINKPLQKENTLIMAADDVARSLQQIQARKATVAYLICKQNNEKHVLDQTIISFGRARTSDIRCGGLFAPNTAALIEQRGDGHYLIPNERGRVFVNNLRIDSAVRLAENDRLDIQGASFTYYIRPVRS
ncbi:FHA domain-containing protein [Chromatium okenii]|jgi:hypothetical protein|uniref:FHA domain-containing protein n=1 Tax=Chromatium okenii TaxID=61644 RepID=A0A2S7XNU1_9GAMM|nr:FHA domain-containing protein [Chromatium okenii]MBV5310339.1 FHA domain-containing protein [Chromatium okenii]PQJ95051.1 hypothetical protein CXB77_12015 [Chromatium okenii]PQJ97659.1 hypothetical protein CXB77_00265 [Chromatium okenii]